MDFSFRVVSFNIRYDTPKDVENSWGNRKALLIETINHLNPDILALQEVLYNQLSYIDENLPGYGYVGVGRDDGEKGGEFVPIFYREKLFDKLDEGYFWLSETPDLPGSKSWGAKLPRVVSWVRLRLKQKKVPRSTEDVTVKEPTSPVDFCVFNAHLSHVSEAARVNGAKLLVNRIGEVGKSCHLILTGDFNTEPNSATYRILTEAIGHDAYVENRDGVISGSYHGFTGVEPSNRFIDWIIVSEDLKSRSFLLCRYNRDGKYPSDHFPVVAMLKV